MVFALSNNLVLSLYCSSAFVDVHLYWALLPGRRLFGKLLTHDVTFYPHNILNWVGTIIITMLHINKLRGSKISNFFQTTQPSEDLSPGILTPEACSPLLCQVLPMFSHTGHLYRKHTRKTSSWTNRLFFYYHSLNQ